MNALTRAWIEVQGLDAAAWAAAAAGLPQGVWTAGDATLSGDGPAATFRRSGTLVDARVEHSGIGYAMVGTSATLNVEARWPDTMMGTLPGHPLHKVVDTPITRYRNATIVTLHAFRSPVDRTLVVATAPVERLGRPK